MCPDRELLSAWLDGEVPSPWRETMARHVEACPACAEAAEAMAGLRAAFSADAASMSGSADEAKRRCEERLRAELPRSPSYGPAFAARPAWNRRALAVPLPLAAAAALAFVALGLALAETGRRNAELRMAVLQAREATSLASSGLGLESVIDFVSRQSGAVNININLPAGAFGGSAGDPFIVREADFNAGSRR